MRRLILKTFLSPGDVLTLTAAVRDLHLAHPGKFQTDVRTSVDALWLHNPRLTPLTEGEAGVESIDMHYPLVHESNQRPYHFLHGYAQHLERQLGLAIPLTRFQGDVHLSEEEKSQPGQLAAEGLFQGRYWIVVAGGKYDFTAKWWNPASFQEVVDHFQGKIQFVQCGEAGHWHPPLERVINLVGKTSPREFIRMVYHADGVLCPVTYAMHLAAALPPKPGGPRRRACVVVAGGREPAHWEAYPQHQFITTAGTLRCCSEGGCWKSRCQLVGDGDAKDQTDVCEQPIQVTPELRIPRCLDMIAAGEVIQRIERYYEGGILEYQAGVPTAVHTNGAAHAPHAPAVKREQLLIDFRHGLGDAVQFTIVLKHLARYRPDWLIDVRALRGKHAALHSRCRRAYYEGERGCDEAQYDQRITIDWHECDQPQANVPSTKAARCLREVFGIEPDPALFRYEIGIGDAARQKAAAYLKRICGDAPKREGRYPTLLLHYQGNTSQKEKNLSHDAAYGMCQAAISAGLVPIVLDWDNRSPLPDQQRIHCPRPGRGDIWGDFGSGDAEVLAALIEQSSLMVGVDSGPLHVAGATTTPTLAVWTQHAPSQYFDLAENATHFVPANWRDFGLARNGRGSEFCEANYRLARPYGNVAGDVMAAILAQAPGGEAELVDGNYLRCGEFWIRRDNAEQDIIVVRDIFEQDAYRTSLLPDRQDEEIVLDIGAHIGCFARRWHQKNPQARIICVEACPENIDLLRRNVPPGTEIVQAACTYEEGPIALLNAVRPNCESTGGSVVKAAGELDTGDLRQPGYAYWHDRRELAKVTLEDLMERFGLERIDVLKLDCEGSEYSILENTRSLPKVRTILGEYHVADRWSECRQRAAFAGWDYTQLHDAGALGGLFQLRNPRYAAEGESADAFQARLKASVHPADVERIDGWLPAYRALFEVARELRPKRIVEIGVRCGYSGLAFLAAVPGAQIVGIDGATDPESESHLQHAETLLAGRNYQLIRSDSHRLAEIPDADLVFIDGEHTYAGCLADLRLAARSTGNILVDDYHSVLVQRAVDDFLAHHVGEFIASEVRFAVDGIPDRGVMRLLRRLEKGQPSRRSACPNRLAVAVPAGIGDSLWALTKLPDMCRTYGVDRAHVTLCGGPPHRAKEFVERFDFVASAEYTDLRCIEEPPYTHEGVYNWVPSGNGWHHQFDWMLVANRHLENGQRLETWLPRYETDFSLAERFTFTGREVMRARDLERELGPYCVFYLGPEKGNTLSGHNRGPLWTPAEWGQLADRCRALGLAIVVVGAEYDRSYFENHVRQHLGERVFDAVGHWPIGQTFVVVQRARFVVAYQSGVGIFAVYLGVPTAMFWRPQRDSIDPDAYVSFDERMAAAWAPPAALESGRYLPSIYTRCSAESIAAHAETNCWHQS